jgi:hypothetical protein
MTGDCHDRFISRTALSQFRDGRVPEIVEAHTEPCFLTNVLPRRFKRGNLAFWLILPASAKREDVVIGIDLPHLRLIPLLVSGESVEYFIVHRDRSPGSDARFRFAHSHNLFEEVDLLPVRGLLQDLYEPITLAQMGQSLRSASGFESSTNPRFFGIAVSRSGCG